MELKVNEYLTIEDQSGDEYEFYVLDIFEYNNKNYIILQIVDEENEDNTEELTVYEILDNEDNNFTQIEDVDTFNAVFDVFLERNKDDFEIEL